MGVSEQPSRPKVVLLWLVGFVVAFAGLSWFVTGGIGHNVAPPANSASPMVTPEPTPPVCGPDQLQLFGAINDCASVESSLPPSCVVSAHALDAVFSLSGTAHNQYKLYVGVARYIGAGDYALNNGAAHVVVRESASTVFWQSITGGITVTANNGGAGIIYANLQPYDVGKGALQPALLPLRVEGPWRCG
jgi:hypothetical protein